MKIGMWHVMRRAVAIFTLILFFAGNAFMPSANAASLISSYNIMKNDPANQQFIQKLKASGADEAQIESFLNDLDSEVGKLGTINDTNFDSLIYQGLKEVITWQKHRTVCEALLNGFGDEINYILTKNELPPNLMGLRNAVYESVLQKNTSVTTGGGGGGAVPAPQSASITNEINRQLSNQGSNIVSLQMTSGNDNLSIPVQDLQQIKSAGRELQISNGNVTLRIPAEALSITANSSLSLSIRALSDASAATALQNQAPGQVLIGKVQELSSADETNSNGVQFQKPVTVVISYAQESLGNATGAKLNVYYYNESTKQWESMNGTQDTNDKTITFSTFHFSKYAIMTVPEQPINGTPPAQAPASNFQDISQHWARQDIETMVQLKLASGVSPSEFLPDRNITRAEFAALLCRALGINPAPQLSGQFNDVYGDKWYYSIVNQAASIGLLKGYNLTLFGPEDPVTREQMAVMISNALSYRGPNSSGDSSGTSGDISIFSDQGSISFWARNSIAVVRQKGIIKGRDDGNFAPLANATRAEASVMILKMYQQL
ncbi:MAG: S-layer homology domain-containing protein [Syntrophomonas sp.]